MKKLIPNILTALNLVLGMLSIIATINGQLCLAAIYILAALVADGLDGRVARYLKVSSEFGKELDSLCDLVSFGAAPAILAYVFMLKDFGYLGVFAAVIFAICGALRLARFNVNTSKVKGHFVGLPIPAGGCLVATFILSGIKPLGFLFPVMIIIFAYLMVSSVRYPDFKGEYGSISYVALIITVCVSIYILYLSVQAVGFVMFFGYVLFGLLNTCFLFMKRGFS